MQDKNEELSDPISQVPSVSTEECVADDLEELFSKLEIQKKAAADPLDPACIKIFDLMKRVTVGVGDEGFKPTHRGQLGEFGCMLEEVADLYSAQVDYCHKFVLSARDKICTQSKNSSNLQQRPVVLMERSRKLDDLAIGIHRMEEASRHEMRDMDVSGVIPRELHFNENEQADNIMSNMESPDEVIASGSIIDAPVTEILNGIASENSELRRSSRIGNRLPGPNFNVFHAYDGRSRRKFRAVEDVHVGTIDSIVGEAFFEADDTETEETRHADPPSMDAMEICSYRVQQTKMECDRMDFVTCCLRNGESDVTLGEFKWKMIQSRRNIVQLYMKTIESFKEPAIVALMDLKAKDLEIQTQTAIDDTANREYQITILETVYVDSLEMSGTNKENINTYGERIDEEFIDSGVSCSRVCATPTSARLLSTPRGSPESIKSVDSAYQSQESFMNSPITICDDQFSPIKNVHSTDSTGNNHQAPSLATPVYMDANTIFKKVLCKGVLTEARVARFANSLTYLLGLKLLDVNHEPLRCRENERSLSEAFIQSARSIKESESLEKSMGKLGSICPSVCSVREGEGVLQFNITPAGVQELEQVSGIRPQVEKNCEEDQRQSVNRNKGRRFIRPEIPRSNVNFQQRQPTNIMQEIQPGEKRKLYEIDTDDSE